MLREMEIVFFIVKVFDAVFVRGANVGSSRGGMLERG